MSDGVEALYARPNLRHAPAAAAPAARAPVSRWALSLTLVHRCMPYTRRVVREGGLVQRAGDEFTFLQLIHSGLTKSVSVSRDGHALVTGLQFKGDWLGTCGLASGRYACDAIALDTVEVWSLRYLALLQAAQAVPALLHTLHVAMSEQVAREHHWRFGARALHCDARVAAFVQDWAAAQAERGLRADTIVLRLSRAEIGSHIGISLETVSRAFTRMQRNGLIRFDDKGRRELTILDPYALDRFVRNGGGRAAAMPVDRATQRRN